jgi:hypothetical protein
MKHHSSKFSAGVLCGLLLTTLFVPIAAESSEPLIKIKYTYYSGVRPKGVERHECELDSHKMSSADISSLAKLIQESQILDKSTQKDFEQSDGGPGYIIDCTSGTDSVKVEWSYKHAPQRIWPLVEFLETRSRITKI